MKTIEEREKIASEGYEDDGYSAGLYMGYVVGATEQKIIDAEWLRSQMKTLYGDEWYDPNIEYWVNEFRKATKQQVWKQQKKEQET